jgi:hypothetical protein
MRYWRAAGVPGGLGLARATGACQELAGQLAGGGPLRGQLARQRLEGRHGAVDVAGVGSRDGLASAQVGPLGLHALQGVAPRREFAGALPQGAGLRAVAAAGEGAGGVEDEVDGRLGGEGDGLLDLREGHGRIGVGGDAREGGALGEEVGALGGVVRDQRVAEQHHDGVAVTVVGVEEGRVDGHLAGALVRRRPEQLDIAGEAGEGEAIVTGPLAGRVLAEARLEARGVVVQRGDPMVGLVVQGALVQQREDHVVQAQGPVGVGRDAVLVLGAGGARDLDELLGDAQAARSVEQGLGLGREEGEGAGLVAVGGQALGAAEAGARDPRVALGGVGLQRRPLRHRTGAVAGVLQGAADDVAQVAALDGVVLGLDGRGQGGQAVAERARGEEVVGDLDRVGLGHGGRLLRQGQRAEERGEDDGGEGACFWSGHGLTTRSEDCLKGEADSGADGVGEQRPPEGRAHAEGS